MNSVLSDQLEMLEQEIVHKGTSKNSEVEHIKQDANMELEGQNCWGRRIQVPLRVIATGNNQIEQTPNTVVYLNCLDSQGNQTLSP